MAKSALNTSMMSLGSCEKAGSVSRTRKGSFEHSIDSEHGYTKRRTRWVNHKCSSLENLTPQSRIDFFKRYELIYKIDKPLKLNQPEIRIIWKAYSKFVKGAWAKTRSLLRARTQKADACEFQERSALMQMSSLSAILNKDQEIMRDQSNELNELSHMVFLLGNDKMLLEECNYNLNLETEILNEEVEAAEQELLRKLNRTNQLQSEVDGLEKSLSKKEEKRSKYSTEIEIRRARVQELCKEYELYCETAQKLKLNLKAVENHKKLLLVEMNDSHKCSKASADILQQETDKCGLLKKKLVETKETNQITAQELNVMQLRLLDQDLSVIELENQLSIHWEELERLKVSKANWGRWDKLLYGTWVAAAACLVQVIRLLQRRWP